VRTVGWLTVLVLNVAVAAAFAPSVFESGAPAATRVIGGAIVATFVGVSTLLVLIRVGKLPSWGTAAMRIFCLGIPVIWLIGALDRGIVSGLEAASVVFVSLLMWSTWRLFNLVTPKA
jgi:hypothetical protein